MNDQSLIAITMGDPCGIGPEIIVKLFAGQRPAGAFVIGDMCVMSRAVAAFTPALSVIEISEPADALGLSDGCVPVLSSSNLTENLPMGQVDARAGRAAYDAVIKAIDLARDRQIDAMVTGPINKEAFGAAGIGFPGHTEILAERTGTADFGMMLANNALRVVLVSIHLSLREALDRVTYDNVRKTIALAEAGGQALGITSPRIAVAGLNPHAGEGGLFGQEEANIIAPAIEAMRRTGIDVSGPYAPDTVFMRAHKGEFDIVVAQYHDQGLIPIKYLGIDDGVNITVGLPIIRTSVDHGTAFDIAGKGVASAKSLETACKAAFALIKARRT